MSEQEQRAERILANLSSINDDLFAFSDDLWGSINYRDPRERDRSIQVVDQYNKQVETYAKVARDVEALIRRIAGLRSEPVHQGTPSGPLPRALHPLTEDFTFTRPLGFQFCGQAYTDTLTWKDLYESVCRLIAELDPKRWATLPDLPVFTSVQGRKAFSRDATDLRGPLPPVNGVFAEVHYSANSIRDNLLKLLTEFGLDQHELQVYLRLERDHRSDIA